MNYTELDESIHQYPIISKSENIVSNQQQSADLKISEITLNFLNSYFDKIYCINLAKRTDKWSSVKNRFLNENINVTRFDAIDGSTTSSQFELTQNEIGCICSHLEIIKDAKNNRYNKILIFEDDVYFSKDFKTKILSIQELEWKLLYLGGSQYRWDGIETWNNFYLSKETLGTFAYAVDCRIYDDLILEFSKKDAPADRILTRIQKKYYSECFTMYPNIVIADVTTSDIRKERNMNSHAELMKWDLNNFSIESKSSKKNILLLPDCRGWAFDNIAQAIRKYNPHPDKINYEIAYTKEIYKKMSTINQDDWDLIYVMYEADETIQPRKNVIRGCYSALWMEREEYSQERIANIFSKCGGAIFANNELKTQIYKYLSKDIDIEVINDASDESIFYPTNTVKNKEFTALYVGNAERSIKNFSAIQRICNEAGVKLKVCTNVPHKNLVHEYNSADILINFSTFEGGPQTFVEASLCQIPTLIRNTIELSKHIPCFTGSTESDFVRILRELKTNRNLCKSKGKEAYDVAIANFTYKKASEKFSQYFLKFMQMQTKQFLEKVTVFIISAGENPNYVDCLKSIQNQNCDFRLKKIKNVSPMSKAFQNMIDECDTEYYIQVDEDMILNPDAIETIFNSLKKSDKNVCMVTYKLKDVHLNFNIYGIKGYKHAIFKRYPYNLNIISCEVDQLNRMKNDGYTIDASPQVIGQHSPKWTNELIYERYFDLMEKWKIYKYDWVEALPSKLLEIFKKDPSDINFFALAGTIQSLVTQSPIRNREKNFTIKNESINILQNMYLDKNFTNMNEFDKNITFLIKSFNRKDSVENLIKSIRLYYPNIPIVIVDDSNPHLNFDEYDKVKTYNIDFDSGLAAGRNCGVSKINTKYFVLLDDDFEFTKETDIKHLYEVISKNNLDILGGQVIENKKPIDYFGNFVYDEKNKLIQTVIEHKNMGQYKKCHLILNFFIAKTESIKNHKWDDRQKLAEHAAFFFEHRDALQIGYVDNVSILHKKVLTKEYGEYRHRGANFFKEWMVNKDINFYINFKHALLVNPTIPESERKFVKCLAIKNLIDINEILRREKIPYWIQDGTLLGYHREQNFIGHDVDADIGIMFEDFSPKVMDAFKNAGFSIKNMFGYPQDSFEISLFRYDVKIDIFFYYKRDDYIYHCAFNQKTSKEYNNKIEYRYEKFNTKEITFLGNKMFAPVDELKFILTKYGENWKTPDPNWDWAYSPKNHVDTNHTMNEEEKNKKIEAWKSSFKEKKKKVITYGTFDTFHYGHMELLKKAKQFGYHLTVGLSTDEFNQIKGKESKFSYQQRYEWLKSISLIDEIIPESNWEQKENDIKKHNIDIMIMGDDWVGKFDNLPCRVIYLNRTPEISSTKIKNIIV